MTAPKAATDRHRAIGDSWKHAALTRFPQNRDQSVTRDVAEVDGNRTRRTRIARATRFEGGGCHQVS